MTDWYAQPLRLIPNNIRGKGGREIDKLRGVVPPMDTPTRSEAWIGSTTHVGNPPKDKPYYGCSEVQLPNGEICFLFEAMQREPEKMLGKVHIEKNGIGMGVLIKYLDAQAQYGLQCHPTRPFALKMWGNPYGKEESWHVIGTRDDTEKPAYILLGFKEGVTREQFEEFFRADHLAALENLCHRIEVKVGETYFVGGGVPHALGEGCLVVEVQEPADITLGARPLSEERRKNMTQEEIALFNERLLGAYRYDGCTDQENLARWRTQPKVLREGSWGREEILIGPEQTSYFSFTRLQAKEETPLYRTGYPQVAIVLEGEGELVYQGGRFSYKKADEIFLPYAAQDLVLCPQKETTLFLCNPEGVTLA